MEGFMEVELMVTKRDDNRRQGEYRAICLWKMDWQSFAITLQLKTIVIVAKENTHNFEDKSKKKLSETSLTASINMRLDMDA